MATFTWLWATGSLSPGHPKAGQPERPSGRTRGQNTRRFPPPPLGGRDLAAGEPGPTVGREVPSHSTGGSRPVKPSSVFLPHRTGKREMTQYTRLSPHPLLSVPKTAKYLYEGRVISAPFPCLAEWFGPSSPRRTAPFPLPPPREWRIGARHRGAGPGPGARGRPV